MLATGAFAAQVNVAEVGYRDGGYRISIDALLDAPLENVRAVILNVDRLPDISPVIREARVISTGADGSEKRRTEIATCVLMFCFEFVMTERFQAGEDGVLVSRIVPAESDFRSGESRWELSPGPDGQTRLRYTSSREPRFWIPPIIGPLVMQKKVRSEVVTSMGLIEAQAQKLRDAAAANTGGLAQ